MVAARPFLAQAPRRGCAWGSRNGRASSAPADRPGSAAELPPSTVASMAGMTGTRLPPMTRLERSLVDAAAWTQHPRSACGLLIAAVQQCLTQPSRLLAELDAVGRVRHPRLLRRVLADVEGGAQALFQVDFGHLCRRIGLLSPVRQALRVDNVGRRRHADVEICTRRGRKLVVEIDGAVHLIVGN